MIGETIKEQRKAKGLTQVELTKKLNEYAIEKGFVPNKKERAISLRTLINMEHGENVTADKIELCLNYFGLEIVPAVKK